jgi:hypothetical protein
MARAKRHWLMILAPPPVAMLRRGGKLARDSGFERLDGEEATNELVPPSHYGEASRPTSLLWPAGRL